MRRLDALAVDGLVLTTAMEIRANTRLPRRAEDVTLHTADGLALVGELALPERRPPVATLVTFHPLPTQGGFMDSHLLRKAAWRLPALADLAVLRFNTRGTSSPRGTSEGAFDGGVGERLDLAAAMDFVAERALPHPWQVGWSFGTELVLEYGLDHPADGAILLSPPLHRTTEAQLARWHGSGRPLVVLVPELDDFLRPDEARRRFAVVPEARVIAMPGCRHLWVGERQTREALTEIVRAVRPQALPLPTEWPVPEA